MARALLSCIVCTNISRSFCFQRIGLWLVLLTNIASFLVALLAYLIFLYWEKETWTMGILASVRARVASSALFSLCCANRLVTNVKLSCGRVATWRILGCCCRHSEIGASLRASAARIRASTVTNWQTNPLDQPGVSGRGRNYSDKGSEMVPSRSQQRMIPTSETEATINVGAIARPAQVINEQRERIQQMEYEIKRLNQQLDVFSSIHNTSEEE